MMFRPLLQAKSVTREGQQTTYSFAQARRARQAEIDVHAKSAQTKVDRARKIAVLRDTTAVKHCAVAVSDPGARGSAVEPANTQTSGDASQLIALVLLQLLVQTYDGHSSSRLVGLLRVWALFQQLLGVPQCFHEDQLHLHEFAALECQKIVLHVNMQLLVKTKPFRQNDKDAANETDSEQEQPPRPEAKHVEVLGGGVASEDDWSDVDDVDATGPATYRSNWRPALAELEAVLQRETERQRAVQPGRHRDSDVQMLANAGAQKPLVDTWAKTPPPRDSNEVRDVVPPGARSSARREHQTAVVKEYRDRENRDPSNQAATLHSLLPTDCHKGSLTHLETDGEERCKFVVLPDVERGPGHVAWMLIQKHGELNDEQIDVIALMVWPVEQAWRARVDTTKHILPADLGLPRVLIIGGGGCGKTTTKLK